MHNPEGDRGARSRLGRLSVIRSESQARYRSSFVRWAFIVSGLLLAAAFSPWAPYHWHSSDSLRWIHQWVPWPVIALLFLGYALLHLWGSVAASITAGLLGLAIFMAETIALAFTARADKFNPIIFVAFFLVCVLHFAAARLAVQEDEDRKAHVE